MADENDSGELESAERSTIATAKNKKSCGKTKNYEYLKEITRYD